jgi:hypothetical protein
MIWDGQEKIESGPTLPLVQVEVAVVEEGQAPPGAVQVEGQDRVEEVRSNLNSPLLSFLSLVTWNISAIRLSKDLFWLIRIPLEVLHSSPIAFYALLTKLPHLIPFLQALVEGPGEGALFFVDRFLNNLNQDNLKKTTLYFYHPTDRKPFYFIFTYLFGCIFARTITSSPFSNTFPALPLFSYKKCIN